LFCLTRFDKKSQEGSKKLQETGTFLFIVSGGKDTNFFTNHQKHTELYGNRNTAISFENIKENELSFGILLS